MGNKKDVDFNTTTKYVYYNATIGWQDVQPHIMGLE